MGVHLACCFARNLCEIFSHGLLYAKATISIPVLLRTDYYMQVE